MLALLALIPLLFTASASPIEKRYNRVMIVSGRDGKCLVAAPKTGVGSPVTSEDCANTQGAKYWNINPGSGSVILSGTENLPDPLALDAGSNPGNNGALKVWKSYPGLYQQTWYLTDDKRIAITGGNQCLDEGTNGIQTYQCTTGNTNQIFNIVGDNTPPPSSSSSSPSSTSSSVKPSGSGGSGQAYRIHPAGKNDQCVTIQNGYDGVGTTVAISSCFTDEFAKYQKWTFAGYNQQGSALIQNVASNHLCLDAGNNPANGSGMKVWTCYNGLLQQMWHYDGHMLTLGNGQALDVQAESQPNSNVKPYGSLKNIITWQASTNGDPQQQFTFEAVSV